MIARHPFAELVAACFPVTGCRVYGYASRAGFRLSIYPPQPFTGPPVYPGSGATCYEALADAVRLFHATAYCYPSAQPLAAPGSYDGTPDPSLPF